MSRTFVGGKDNRKVPGAAAAVSNNNNPVSSSDSSDEDEVPQQPQQIHVRNPIRENSTSESDNETSSDYKEEEKDEEEEGGATKTEEVDPLARFRGEALEASRQLDEEEEKEGKKLLGEDPLLSLGSASSTAKADKEVAESKELQDFINRYAGEAAEASRELQEEKDHNTAKRSTQLKTGLITKLPKMREGTYSRSSFTINNDGTWTAEEAGGHTFRHSRAASSAEGKGSWKKVGSNYEFSVEKYETHNSDRRSKPQDYQGKTISRTVSEIDTAGAFKSLFFDIDLTLKS